MPWPPPPPHRCLLTHVAITTRLRALAPRGARQCLPQWLGPPPGGWAQPALPCLDASGDMKDQAAAYNTVGSYHVTSLV